MARSRTFTGPARSRRRRRRPRRDFPRVSTGSVAPGGSGAPASTAVSWPSFPYVTSRQEAAPPEPRRRRASPGRPRASNHSSATAPSTRCRTSFRTCWASSTQATRRTSPPGQEGKVRRMSRARRRRGSSPPPRPPARAASVPAPAAAPPRGGFLGARGGGVRRSTLTCGRALGRVPHRPPLPQPSPRQAGRGSSVSFPSPQEGERVGRGGGRRRRSVRRLPPARAAPGRWPPPPAACRPPPSG